MTAGKEGWEKFKKGERKSLSVRDREAECTAEGAVNILALRQAGREGGGGGYP